MGTALILGCIIGAVAGGIGVIIVAIFQPKKFCHDCGKSLPKVRIPGSGRQILWGGMTCPNCGCEVDRSGRKVK